MGNKKRVKKIGGVRVPGGEDAGGDISLAVITRDEELCGKWERFGEQNEFDTASTAEFTPDGLLTLVDRDGSTAFGVWRLIPCNNFDVALRNVQISWLAGNLIESFYQLDVLAFITVSKCGNFMSTKAGGHIPNFRRIEPPGKGAKEWPL